MKGQLFHLKKCNILRPHSQILNTTFTLMRSSDNYDSARIEIKKFLIITQMKLQFLSSVHYSSMAMNKKNI